LSSRLQARVIERTSSLESLKEIDRFLDDHTSEGTPKPDGLLSEQFGSRMFALGAYVGEVLRRKQGGSG
jgi:hypothetical protein